MGALGEDTFRLYTGILWFTGFYRLVEHIIIDNRQN